MKSHYRYIMWISGRQLGLVPFHGLWWLSWTTLLAFGQIWWFKVVQVLHWLVRLCRYVTHIDKKMRGCNSNLSLDLRNCEIVSYKLCQILW